MLIKNGVWQAFQDTWSEDNFYLKKTKNGFNVIKLQSKINLDYVDREAWKRKQMWLSIT